MTDAGVAAIVDVTLDSTSVQEEDLGIHLDVVRGFNEIPTTRGVDVAAAHRSGRIAYPRLPDVLRVELAGHIWAVAVPGATTDDDLRADFRGRANALRILLAAASLVEVVLECALEDDSTATINVRVIDYQVREIIASVAAEVRVALESVDPYWVITPAGS